jgi:hypothetical protein
VRLVHDRPAVDNVHDAERRWAWRLTGGQCKREYRDIESSGLSRSRWKIEDGWPSRFGDLVRQALLPRKRIAIMNRAKECGKI